MNSNLLSDWLGYINSNRPNEEEFGLERLRELYKKTVSQNLANKVVIVGGTNGKGTTVEYLKNFLIESGSNVGEVARCMGKNKVLVKVGQEGKYYLDLFTSLCAVFVLYAVVVL